MIVSSSDIEDSFGSYIRSKPHVLTSPRIISLIDLYRRSFSKKMDFLDPSFLDNLSSRQSFWSVGQEVFVSEKIDGENAFFVFDSSFSGSSSFFCNTPSHRVWLGLKANDDLESLLRSHGITQAILAGELCAPSSPLSPDFDQRFFVRDFLSASRNPQSQEQLDSIAFRAFDLLSLNDDDTWLERSFSDRYSTLQSFLPSRGRVAYVSYELLKDHQLKSFYSSVVIDKNAEGLVIRNSSTNHSYKVKPLQTLDAVIIGAVSSNDVLSPEDDSLHSALLALRYEDGSYQVVSKCGGGLSDRLRKDLWNRLTFVPSPGFVCTTSDSRAYRMVKPEIVVQIHYLDIITHSYKGEPVYQNVLRYNPSISEWEPLHSVPFVRLLSPFFVKDDPVREDKTPDALDIRIQQITNLVSLDDVQLLHVADLPSSTLLARYVFDNGPSVRKFFVVSTNKHDLSPLYPRFVIVHVDYSEKRADPLHRSVKVTNDETQAWQLFDSLVLDEMLNNKKDGLKRGWTLYDRSDQRSEPLDIPLK